MSAATWRLGLRRWFWGEGVCLLGLARASRALTGRIDPAVADWYDAALRGGIDPLAGLDHVNEVAPGTAALLVGADDPGRAAAYAPALACLTDWALGPGIGRDVSGAMEHWPGGVWADTMMMAGAYLAWYGVLGPGTTRDDQLRRGDALAEGISQVLGHDALLQRADGLYVHGTHRREAIPCAWGRANAWAALAHVETLAACRLAPAVHPGLPDEGPRLLTARLEAQLTALAPWQPDHGVWEVLVDRQVETRGILETSAAAGLAAAYLRHAASPDVTPARAAGYAAAGWRALAGVLAYVDDAGVLGRVSAGTVLQLVPFGYSVIRDDRPQPWGQGLLLLALAAGLEALAAGLPPG